MLFRCVNKTGSIWGRGVAEKVDWSMVRECASKASLDKLAPHDLRRTCARLCHESGGELEQIQFLLGHVSCKPLSATWAANNGCEKPSMTRLAWKLPNRPRTIDTGKWHIQTSA